MKPPERRARIHTQLLVVIPRKTRANLRMSPASRWLACSLNERLPRFALAPLLYTNFIDVIQSFPVFSRSFWFLILLVSSESVFFFSACDVCMYIRVNWRVYRREMTTMIPSLSSVYIIWSLKYIVCGIAFDIDCKQREIDIFTLYFGRYTRKYDTCDPRELRLHHWYIPRLLYIV